MKFLCDEMLKGMARWLRAAGYDVSVAADGMSDFTLLQLAKKEGRTLLTRDRRFFQSLNDTADIVLLECNDQDACFREISNKVGVDWLHKPFTRCLACNTVLLEAPAQDWDKMPPQSRAKATRLLICPKCRQLFWDGSHVKKMKDILESASRHATA